VKMVDGYKLYLVKWEGLCGSVKVVRLRVTFLDICGSQSRNVPTFPSAHRVFKEIDTNLFKPIFPMKEIL